jgi:hypothetical protein
MGPDAVPPLKALRIGDDVGEMLQRRIINRMVLMKGGGATGGKQQHAGRLGAEGEICVLGAVAGIGLVEAAESPKGVATHRESEGPEQAGIRLGPQDRCGKAPRLMALSERPQPPHRRRGPR